MIPISIQKDILEKQSLRAFINMQRNFPEYQEEVSEMINHKIKYQNKLMNKEKDIICTLYKMLPSDEDDEVFLEPIVNTIEKEIVKHYSEFRKQKTIWLKLCALDSECHPYRCNKNEKLQHSSSSDEVLIL